MAVSSIWNTITKIGKGLGKVDFFGHVVNAVKKGGQIAQTISRRVGDIEAGIDQALSFGSKIPIARELVDLVRNNEIYKGVRGTIDDARSVIEGDAFGGIVDAAEAIDRNNHPVDDYVSPKNPVDFERIGDNIGGVIDQLGGIYDKRYPEIPGHVNVQP